MGGSPTPTSASSSTAAGSSASSSTRSRASPEAGTGDGVPARTVTLALLGACIALAACTQAVTEPRPSPTTDAAQPTVLRYVALGDSYTIGTSVPQEDRWPDQLVSRLAAAPPPAATLELVANHAVNGYTAGTVV